MTPDRERFHGSVRLLLQKFSRKQLVVAGFRQMQESAEAVKHADIMLNAAIDDLYCTLSENGAMPKTEERVELDPLDSPITKADVCDAIELLGTLDDESEEDKALAVKLANTLREFWRGTSPFPPGPAT